MPPRTTATSDDFVSRLMAGESSHRLRVEQRCGSAVAEAVRMNLSLIGFVSQVFSTLPRRAKYVISAISLGRVLVSGLDIAAVIVLGMGVDRLSASGTSSAAQLLALSGAGLVVRSLLSLMLSRLSFQYLARLETEVGARFTESVFSSHQDALDSFRGQDLAFALSQGTNSMTTRALGFTMIVFADGLSAVALLLAFTSIYPLEGLALMGLSILVIVPVQRLVSRRVIDEAAAWSTSIVAVLNQVQEFQSLRREIFLNSASRQTSDRLTADRKRAAHHAAHFNFLLTVPKTVVEVGVLLVAALALILARASRTDEQFLVLAVMLVAVTFRVAPLASSVAGALGVISQSQGESSINQSLLLTIGKSSSDESPLSLSTSPPEAALEMFDVNYTYPGARHTVLDSVSFVVRRGEVCAIVGPSGSGKTTLLECMLGLRIPSSGNIRIFGRSPEDLRSDTPGAVGLVSQSPSIRSTSLARNVAMFASEELDRDRVTELLGRVGLSALVDRLPDGIDTEVGEGQIQLSGGEKQRVGIARALYRDPALLVLDEPTSALDGLNEEAIFELLQAERQRRTVILITHRRPAGFVFDRVLTVDAGTVLVTARHDDAAESAG